MGPHAALMKRLREKFMLMGFFFFKTRLMEALISVSVTEHIFGFKG